MVLYVIAVGRLRSPTIRETCTEYETRTRRYVKLEVREVRDGGRGERDAARIRRVEGAALLKAVPPGALLVAVTRSGRPETSSGLARRLSEWQRDDRDVALAIGGAHGLDQGVLDRADSNLSLSQLTFPHELARLVLLEQLYRACTILRGEPYHKGR